MTECADTVNPAMREKRNKITAAVILLAALLLIALWSACTPWVGWWPESNFTLSPDSRFPRWFAIPPGYDRRDLTVKIYYYSPPPPFRSNTKVILLGPPPDRRKLVKKIGHMRWHPSMNKSRNDRGGLYPEAFPMVTVDTIDGIEEIIEQKGPESILYISDDPHLRRAIAIPDY